MSVTNRLFYSALQLFLLIRHFIPTGFAQRYIYVAGVLKFSFKNMKKISSRYRLLMKGLPEVCGDVDCSDPIEDRLLVTP